MFDNCSNCEYSRTRRLQCVCLNKNAVDYATTVSLRYICPLYHRGTQSIVFNFLGEQVFPPKENNNQ